MLPVWEGVLLTDKVPEAVPLAVLVTGGVPDAVALTELVSEGVPLPDDVDVGRAVRVRDGETLAVDVLEVVVLLVSLEESVWEAVAVCAAV